MRVASDWLKRLFRVPSARLSRPAIIAAQLAPPAATVDTPRVAYGNHSGGGTTGSVRMRRLLVLARRGASLHELTGDSAACDCDARAWLR